MTSELLSILGDLAVIVGAPTAFWWIRRLRAENRRMRALLGRQKGSQTPA